MPAFGGWLCYAAPNGLLPRSASASSVSLPRSASLAPAPTPGPEAPGWQASVCVPSPAALTSHSPLELFNCTDHQTRLTSHCCPCAFHPFSRPRRAARRRQQQAGAAARVAAAAGAQRAAVAGAQHPVRGKPEMLLYGSCLIRHVSWSPQAGSAQRAAVAGAQHPVRACLHCCSNGMPGALLPAAPACCRAKAADWCANSSAQPCFSLAAPRPN